MCTTLPTKEGLALLISTDWACQTSTGVHLTSWMDTKLWVTLQTLLELEHGWLVGFLMSGMRCGVFTLTDC